MSTFDDLLDVMSNLNNPTEGATSAWKSRLQGINNQPPDVKTKVAKLSVVDDAFNTELQPIIQNPARDAPALAGLIMLIEGYLLMTNELYASLLDLRYSKAADRTTATDIRDARLAVREMLRKARESLAEARFPLEVTPPSLGFIGIIGGPNPDTQEIGITNIGGDSLTWHAEAATTSSGNWLIISPTEGRLEPPDYAVSASTTGESGSGNSTSVTVAALLLEELSAQSTPYTGTVSICERDADGLLVAESTKVFQVSFNVCTIASSPASLPFDYATDGIAPGPQVVTITAIGTGENLLNWTATPTVSWLTATPYGSVGSSSPAQVIVGVTVDNPDVGTGTYTGAIVLTPADANYKPLGTPQIIEVTLTVKAAPVLVVNPVSGLVFKDSTGISAQSITISNAGDEPMIWTASLDKHAPGFVSLSLPPASGVTIQGGTVNGTTLGGKSSVINVIVDATGITDNETHNTKVTITATDPSASNPQQAVAGSPVSLPVSIQIASYGLFLCVLEQFYPPDSHGNDAPVVRQTERLFKREHMTLSDRQLDHLTRSWDRVIDFVANPTKYAHLSSTSTCLTNARIVDLFTLHGLLDQLYDRINSVVTRSTEDVFSLE